MRPRRTERAFAAVLAAAALVLVACGGSSASTTTSRTPLRPTPGIGAAQATASTNALTVALLRSLAPATGNAVFSPYSIEAALAMVYPGSAGRTARQIGAVLHSPDAGRLAASNAALSGALERAVVPPKGTPAGDAAKLSIANGLWVQSGMRLKAPFTSTLAGDFGATPQPADFAARPEQARAQINAWIAGHTAQIIKNLMPPGSITTLTVLVLANAIYLKAHWVDPFTEGQTAKAPFHAPARTVSVPFMTQAPTHFAYAGTAAYQAIELPYLNSTLSMLVVMPQPGRLAVWQRGLTAGALARIEDGLHTTFVKLRMPRYHLKLQANLKPILSALGMPVAFTDRADFSAITTARRLLIGAVQHGADLLADEQGTVAAAATGISIGATAAPGGTPTVLTLDHPFLFFLRDQTTGTVLFAGRVADPSSG